MKQTDEFSIQETVQGFNLTLKTTYDLFSYKKIDEGTKLLIETLEVENGKQCLDLGCGYGAIGITLAKLNPSGTIYMVDRDFVAIEYSKINCELNNVSNCKVLLSNGFSNLENVQFDLIVSNLPTHIAREALSKIIVDSKEHLSKQGQFVIVCTTRLKPFMQRLLTPVFGNPNELAQKRGYTILQVIND